MPKNKFPPRPPNYCRAIVVVHGKSERLLVEFLKRNFRLNIAIIASSNGGSSIQVNGLLNFMMSNMNFKNIKSVENAFSVQVENKKIIDCPIFTIMDLDDCSQQEAECYKSGQMFKETWFADYIVPLWFSPDFDKAMKKADFMDKLPSNREKGKVYSVLFQKELTGLERFETFKEKMKKSKDTNIEVLVEYCAYIVEKYKK